VLDRVRGLGENGTLMTSVCTGALILAAAGLLEGRPATTHWSALDSLASYGVEVRPEARFVDTGKVVTSAGVSAGIDMALHLIARLDSPERARGVRRYIQYDPEPSV
jgi:transcriptional regulator GlxA family with amidase domain